MGKLFIYKNVEQKVEIAFNMEISFNYKQVEKMIGLQLMGTLEEKVWGAFK